MTDLERRALLGDKQAQEECTRQGILLPCPFCGSAAMIEYGDIMPFEYSVFCGDCGVMPSTSEDKQVAIRAWNTRPEIERCRDCLYWTGTEADSVAPCRENKNLMFPKNGYCHQFSKKGE